MTTPAKILGGRYRLTEQIGQGGVGTVYRAIQEPLGRTVAVKSLRPEYSQNPVIRRRFTREARAVAGLNHPNIATIFDFGVETDGTMFIAMEYVDGQPLSALMREGMTPTHLLAVLDPILAALAHAHARGIIHRDLKPDNILIQRDPDTGEMPCATTLDKLPQRVKLVDFGIATVYGSSEQRAPSDTRAGEVVGTPLYMSPEQARGERNLTPAVDLYMLGVVLFEGLTGRHPFTGLDPDETSMDIMIRHVTMAVPDVQPPPGVYVPEALRATVKRCLRKAPNERFTSAAQVRDALREARALIQAQEALLKRPPLPDEDDGDTREHDALSGDGHAGPPVPVAFSDMVPGTRPPPPVELPVRPIQPSWLNPSSKLAQAIKRTYQDGVDDAIEVVSSAPPLQRDTVEEDPLQPDATTLSADPEAHTLARAIRSQAPGRDVVSDWRKMRTDMRSALRGVRFDVPLVGRQDERAKLLQLVDQCVFHGLGQVVLLEGETGVGKTKLANWLGEHVSEQGRMRFITGAFVREDDTGLRGLRDALELLFGVRQEDRTRARETIHARMKRWGLDDPRDLETITAFLRPADGGNPTRTRQEPLFAMLVRILERAGRERPLMLFLDDIHWAGPTLGDFLEFLAIEFRYRPCGILLLASIGREDLNANPRMAEARRRLARYTGETVVRMPINRLEGDACGVLIESILPADDALKDAIVQRSHGNPLHVVQLLQYLYQEELLEWDGGRNVFRVVDEAEAIHRVPPDLADLLLLRFEQIEARHEGRGRLITLLEHCAVLGDRFAFEVVELMLHEAHNDTMTAYLEEGIDILLREAILTPIKGRGEDMLAFNHGMIREVLSTNMTGLLQSRRLHRLAARAKERFYDKRLETVAQEIAHHWLQAGDRRKALDFFLIAAKAARASYRLVDAVELFGRALELVAVVPGVEPSMQLKLTRRIGGLREAFGEFRAAAQAYANLLRYALFEGPNAPLDLDPSDTLLPTAEISLLLGALDRSPRRAELGEAALEEVLRGTLGLGRVCRLQGDLGSAVAFLQRAETMASQAQAEAWIHAARLQLGRVAWTEGDYDRAERLGDAGLKAAHATNNSHNRAEALHLLAEVARMRADPARTAELLVRAREAYEILNDRRHAAMCLRDLAQLARARNDLENAARLFAEARQRFEEIGDRHAVASCFNGLGEVARFSNRPKVANSCYRRAFETFHSLGAPVDAALSLTNLGICTLALNNLGEAEQALTQALELTQGLVVQPYLALGLHLHLALLRARQDRWDDVPEHLRIALEHCDRHNIADPDYALPLETLGNLMIDTGNDPDLGQTLIQRARGMWRSLGHPSL